VQVELFTFEVFEYDRLKRTLHNPSTVLVAAVNPQITHKIVFFTAAMVLGQSAEAGEGGAIAALSTSQRSYRLLTSQSDTFSVEQANSLLKRYVHFVHESYALAHTKAREMQVALATFADKPNSKNFQAAKLAWLAARKAYTPTEAFRFYDGPIDVAASNGQGGGPESRLNAWPLNEAVIDYVADASSLGLIGDSSIPINAETVLARDQISDEADVTTGFHALEFLLWGQDFADAGPGSRPITDYTIAANADRRKQYLLVLSASIVQDLQSLERDWDVTDQNSFATHFLALDRYEALGRVLTGAAAYAGFELASERLSVPLDSGMQEDEHSCFSDNTTEDFVAGVDGIARLITAIELIPLLGKVDNDASTDLGIALKAAQAAVKRLPKRFDQILVSSMESRSRKSAEDLVLRLQQLSSRISFAGKQLGVLISVPQAP
jgi:putative iron-regulated protein